MTSIEKAKEAAKILDSKKASNIEVIHIEKISDITDYFVIATGNVNTHVHALSDELEFRMGEKGEKPQHTEGYSSGAWILQDYGDVIIHIFTPDMREFYDLGRLWSDGKKVIMNFDES